MIGSTMKFRVPTLSLATILANMGGPLDHESQEYDEEGEGGSDEAEVRLTMTELQGFEPPSPP